MATKLGGSMTSGRKFRMQWPKSSPISWNYYFWRLLHGKTF